MLSPYAEHVIDVEDAERDKKRTGLELLADTFAMVANATAVAMDATPDEFDNILAGLDDSIENDILPRLTRRLDADEQNRTALMNVLAGPREVRTLPRLV